MSTLSRFAGLVYPDSLQVENLIHPMLNTMEKGIDGHKDTYNYKNFQFGSIGSRVFFNKEKNLCLVFDGFIDNVPELCKLLAEEKIYCEESSEKVILGAYEAFGIDFLDKLNGSFALSLFDKQNQSIILARDRIGIKPIYWYQGATHFIFGSELKALLSTGLIPQTPSQDALSMYLYFGFIPQDMSPIKDINKLLPGTYLIYQPHEGINIRSYWSYSSFFVQEISDAPDLVEANLSNLLREATKRILPLSEKDRSEPVGCFVSGGLGSATVALEVSRLLPPGGANAYSVGFKGENTLDIKIASEVSTLVGLPQTIDYITSETIADNLVNIVWSLDEPIGDPVIAATWKLAEIASKNSKIVYSGMGSDEFLAGHNRYINLTPSKSLFLKLKTLTRPFIKKTLIPMISLINTYAALTLLKLSKNHPWQFQYMSHNALFDEKKIVLASPKLAAYLDPDTFLHKFNHLNRIKSVVSSLLYLDVKTRLPDNFILQFERLTKVHGLQWRSPFLDRHLIEYAASLPEPNIHVESQTGSYLKPLIEGIFPSHVVDRPKRFRKDFLNDWIETPEMETLFNLLLKGTLIETGFISKKWLTDELQKPAEEKNFTQLWSILVLEVWFHLFINHPILKKPPTTDLKSLLSEP